MDMNAHRGNFEIRNPEIEEKLRLIGRSMKDSLPEGWGFIHIIFRYDGEGTFYISSGERQDCIKFMRDFIRQWEEN